MNIEWIIFTGIALASIFWLVRYKLRVILVKISSSKTKKYWPPGYGNNATELLDSVSVLWAWGDLENTCEMLTLIEKDQLAACRSHPTPKAIDKIGLIQAVGITMILLYQKYNKNFVSTRQCNYWPNCSNYSIGLLRRYSFFYAVKKTLNRILSCNGSSEGLKFD